MKVLCSTQMGSTTVMGQTMRVIAIAKALQRNGHQVKYLAGEKLIPVIKDYGIEFIPLPEMPKIDFFPNDKIMQDEGYRAKFVTGMKEIFKLLTQAEKKAIADEKSDLMLCGTPSGLLSAKSAGIPCILTFLQPHGQKTLSHFRERIPAGTDRQKYISEMIEIFTQGISAGQSIQDFVSDALKAIDLILLEGMPEISGGADLNDLGAWFQQIKDKICFTGPLLPQTPESLPDQQKLKLRYSGKKDKPLVYVTIGGGSGLIGEEFLKLVLNMFRSLPEVEGVIAVGLAIDTEKLSTYDPPDNVSIKGFVPGTELVKASDAIIFHGGSSTLMTCIACGKPGIVIPSMGEQEDNGAVLVEHGAGIVLDKQTLTPNILAEAVRKILVDSAFLVKAQKLKELSEHYGGASKAATLIEEVLNGRLVGAGTYSSSR